MPFGKYCRKSPFVFSLDPLCQGLLGSQKYTWMLVASVNFLCSASSEPRSQVSDLYSSLGNLRDCLIRALDHGVRCPVVDFSQHHIPSFPLYQRGNVAVFRTRNEISFPVTRHRSIFH